MAKPKKRYVCQACGSVSHRWQGQCADCAEWNTLVEDAPATVFSMKPDLSSGGRAVEFVELDKPGPLPVRQPTRIDVFGLESNKQQLYGCSAVEVQPSKEHGDL